MNWSRIILITCLFFGISVFQAEAQVLAPLPAIDTAAIAKKSYIRRLAKDSAFYVRQKFVTDSIIYAYLDPARFPGR